MSSPYNGGARITSEQLEQAWAENWTPKTDSFFTHEATCPLPTHNPGGGSRMLIRVRGDATPIMYCQQCGGGPGILSRVAQALGLQSGDDPQPTGHSSERPAMPPALTLRELYELPRWIGVEKKSKKPENVGPPGEVWIRIHSHKGHSCTSDDGMPISPSIAWQGGTEFHRDQKGNVHRRRVLPWTTRQKVLDGDWDRRKPQAASYVFTANDRPAPLFFLMDLDPPKPAPDGSTANASDIIRDILSWAQKHEMPIEVSQSGRGYHAVGLLDQQAKRLLKQMRGKNRIPAGLPGMVGKLDFNLEIWLPDDRRHAILTRNWMTGPEVEELPLPVITIDNLISCPLLGRHLREMATSTGEPPVTNQTMNNFKSKGVSRNTMKNAALWLAHNKMKTEFIYEEGRNVYWRYQDGRWLPLESGSPAFQDAIERVRHDAIQEMAEAGLMNEANFLDDTELWQKYHRSDSFLGPIRNILAGEAPEPRRDVIGTPNVAVDLRTGDSLHLAPELGLRAITAGRYLPELREKHHEVLQERFSKIFSEENLEAYLQLVGLAMTGRGQPHRALVVVTGRSGSGREAAVRVLVDALGELAMSADCSWLSNETADEVDSTWAGILEHRSVVIGLDELSHRSISYDQLIEVTSSPPVVVRHPNGKILNRYIQAMLWATAVTQPEMPAGPGLSRRLAVLPTLRRLEEQEFDGELVQDQELLDAIVTEAAIRAAEVYKPGYVAPVGNSDAKEQILRDMGP